MNGEDKFFVDTNVLIYFFDSRNAVKQARARSWIAAIAGRDLLRVSWQVIHEFYSTAVRAELMPPAEIRAAIKAFCQADPAATTWGTIHLAWRWRDKAQVNYWDAILLAAAEQAGCRYLLSEDFQSGRKYGSVTVVNPFERDPAQLGLA
jgi:predicted nucleic acid-binding protein